MTALKTGLLVGLVNLAVLSILSMLGIVVSAPELAVGALLVLVWATYAALTFASAVWVALEVSGLIEAPARLSEVWSPAALVRSDRKTALFEALLGGLAAGILSGVVAEGGGLLVLIISSVTRGQTYAPTIENLIGVALESDFVGTVVLAILVMVFVLTAWGRFTLTRLYLGCTGRLPLRLMRFLATARNSGIMRQTGPAYQFRHLTLQDRLASGPLDTNGQRPPTFTKKLGSAAHVEPTHQARP